MIKCKLKCDKNYGGQYPLVDCDIVSETLLKEIINKFTVDNVLCVTEEVVDYYNTNNTLRKNSFKSANAIIRNLRKILKDK